MKRRFVKTFCIAIACIMLSCTALPLVSAASNRITTPVVYVHGQGDCIYDDPTSASPKQLFPVTIEDGYIGDKAVGLIPIFLKALVSDNWDEYCNYIYDAVAPLYEEIQLDNNGEASNGSGIKWNWPSVPLNNRNYGNGYALVAYTFIYDWRLDPCVIADQLNSYVEEVKRVTGFTKVNFVGRCLGANIVLAYLAEYGYDSVDNVSFFISSSNGLPVLGAVFSGELYIDADSVDRYLIDTPLEGDFIPLLKATVTLMNETTTLSGVTGAVNNIYNKVSDKIVNRLLFAVAAKCPGYWSMVDDTYYEKAKVNVFGADYKNGTEYDGLIEKIDNYHYNVNVKQDEIITEMHDAGIDFQFIAKYGYQLIPVMNGSDVLGDGLVTVEGQTHGATCAVNETVLSDEYIAGVTAAGNGKYISPDKCIDMSTALLPDSAWVIKNIEHKDFPACLDNLMISFFANNGDMDVNTFAEYPQYMVYDGETSTISPMTSSNGNQTDRWKTNFFKALMQFVNKLVSYIVTFVNGLNIE